MRRRLAKLRSLPARLVAMLSLALLPLGVISLYQTRAVLEEARSLNRASLKGRTVEAAMAERELIQEALGAAQGLGAAVLATERSICSDVMAQFIKSHPQFIFAGFIDETGFMECSSARVARDFSRNRVFLEIQSKGSATVEISGRGAVTGQPVIIASHPVWQQGQQIGYVSISIPHRLADALMTDSTEDEGLRLATVSTDGEVISATGGADSAATFLPADIPLETLAGRVGQTFDAVVPGGEERVFAVSAMIPGSVALVGSWPEASARESASQFSVFLSVLFPGLMWIAGVTVAYVSVQRLVIRHISRLRSAMRQYALGELRGGRLDLDNPPEELADTARAFNRMILFLAQAEAQQEQDLRDKEVLLKEVHHRVKNNLQLIASIMNMQARTAKTPEARRMLAGLQRRVRGLAMMHRTLYTTPDMTAVNAAEMVQAMVKDLSGLPAEAGVTVQTRLDEVLLWPDQAVPLSMLLAEALTNALKYVGYPDRGAARIAVDLSLGEDGQVRFAVENTTGRPVTPVDEDATESGGLGSQLMRAFVGQLDGTDEVEHAPGLYRYVVRFNAKEFVPEEQGQG
ncbi:sensor histidine kinase [Tropicibacter oceani]|uniref:histidine kinase n=1 Tax=Tropicibacter oceani TaxID=3058420 RepID=A0ABY8QLQ7_9RHOB|nr:histidine kinase dimerization/phosphoacceptor domain -containing protein [Tropicibacter oceani]WGW05580.1 histidine kinase dimerization/phosphoacceptor domain -containing protein [Tropicibacter oceani]